MEELCVIVAEQYGGSLKAEHSTGRNMAPFVEREWGARATALMWELKRIFDPEFILNPGVILNGDPAAHLKALKVRPGGKGKPFMRTAGGRGKAGGLYGIPGSPK